MSLSARHAMSNIRAEANAARAERINASIERRRQTMLDAMGPVERDLFLATEAAAKLAQEQRMAKIAKEMEAARLARRRRR